CSAEVASQNVSTSPSHRSKTGAQRFSTEQPPSNVCGIELLAFGTPRDPAGARLPGKHLQLRARTERLHQPVEGLRLARVFAARLADERRLVCELHDRLAAHGQDAVLGDV